MNLKALSTLLIISTAQSSIFAQNKRKAAVVRAEIKTINANLRRLKKEPKNVFGLSLKGSEAVYFLAGIRIRKFIAVTGGET